MSILFPHLVEDIEYLLPENEVAVTVPMDVDPPAPSAGAPPQTPTRQRQVNAVAGPSRRAV